MPSLFRADTLETCHKEQPSKLRPKQVTKLFREFERIHLSFNPVVICIITHLPLSRCRSCRRRRHSSARLCRTNFRRVCWILSSHENKNKLLHFRWMVVEIGTRPYSTHENQQWAERKEKLFNLIRYSEDICAWIHFLARCTPVYQVQVSFNKNPINALTFHMCHKNIYCSVFSVRPNKLKEKHRRWQRRRWRRRVGNQQRNEIEVSWQQRWSPFPLPLYFSLCTQAPATC